MATSFQCEPACGRRYVAASGWQAMVFMVLLCLLATTIVDAAPRRDWRAAAPATLELRAATPIRVVIPDDADETVQAAAELLQATVERTWDTAEVSIVDETTACGVPSPGIDFTLGLTAPLGRSAAVPPLSELDTCHYSIQPRQRRIALHASNSEALYLATARWLDSEFGVRWYFPGELGEVLPRHSAVRLRAGIHTLRPAFWSRSFSVVGSTADSRQWERLNGMRRAIHFGHSLNRIFTRELLLEQPELAASVGDIRLIPPSQAVGWRYQPDLSCPEVAAVAAAVGRQRLEANPTAYSFSVAINDNTNFGDSPGVRERVEPLRFFRRRPDYSDLVFTFTNRVAEQMGSSLDGRYLTALAYYWAEDVPGFPVHPRVMPILTADRSQYFDPQFKANDLELMRRWGNSGVEAFGLWDYYYGAPFIAPRLFFPAIEESIRSAHRAGARSFYAEIIPIWAWDGAKNWIAARLTWDPELSAAALLAEYCQGLYGPAAPQMEQILRLWSMAWMNQPGSAEWIKYYRDDSELAIYPEELWQETDALLKAATAAVPEESAEHQRIQLFAQAYGVARHAKAVYDQRSIVLSPSTGSVEDLIQAIACFRTALGDFRSARDAASESEPLLMNLSRTRATRQSDPSLSSLLAYLEQQPQVYPAAMAALVSHGEITADLVVALTLIDDPAAATSFANAAFTCGTPIPTTWRYPTWQHNPRLEGWYFFIRPTQGAMAALQWRADRNSAYLQIESTELAQLRQEVAVTAGTTLVATIDVQGSTLPDSRIEWMLEWLDSNGSVIRTLPVVDRLPHGPIAHWHTLALTASAPEAATHARIRLLAQRLAANDWISITNPQLMRSE